ncbi:hypothetical protein GJAV_G00197970 [Gymnothorax javanicus]|nr:hypothetical protein GJAV_G00197970 [Gymnothorax javanicus]
MLLVSQRLDAPRMEPLLPGSMKRKLAAAESLGEVNGVSDGSMNQGNGKRLCLDDVTLAMGPSFQHPPYSSGPGVGGPSSGLEGNGLSNNGLGSPYAMPPKASPGPVAGGAAHGNMLPSFNPPANSTAPSVEQELQDILDELTKNPDPALTELDIEKILGNKSDEQASTVGGFAHPEGSGTPKRSPQRPSHLESHLTCSPGFTAAGSPQVGPSPPYSLPHSAKPVPSPLSASPLSSSAQSQSQARSPMLSAALTNRPATTAAWHEVSRAQQLQQMASNSKHLSSGSAPPPPQGPPWTGPSPPYRANEKLPGSSPHQQPFSPAGNIQSPQSALLSGMAPAPSAGPSPPYRPEKLSSPALAQPPFSPQSASLLAGTAASAGSSSSAQSSQAGFLPGVAPSSGSTRPSPPYRTDKHSSPTAPQQQQQSQPPSAHSFSSQNGSGGMTSQLFKAMTSGQPSSLKMLMQQQQSPAGPPQSQSQVQLPPSAHPGIGKAGAASDPYSFNNTKPLRHFDPEPPAQKLGPLGPGQSLGHYPPNMAQGPPGAGLGPGHSQILQQQEMQQRMQQRMQAAAMAPHSRGDQGSGMVPRLQDPSAVPRPAQSNSYNMLLKTQLIRKQLLQEKQRRMEPINGGQMSDCQQVAPFQGVGRSLPSECGFPMGTPSANPSMLSHNPMLSSRMGLPPGPLNQPGRGVSGAFMGNAGPKQPLYHPPQEFGVPLQPGQGMMGMGVPPRQPTHHSQAPARSGMPGAPFPGGSLQPQHLRHALQQGGALPRMVFNPQQPTQPQSQLWQQQQQQQQQQQGLPRLGCDSHADPSLHQHAFPGRGSGGGPHQFPQPLRSGMPANFPPHQPGAPPPNQVAPNLPGRHMQKLPPGHPHPSVAQQSLRPRGPLSAMAVMKPAPLGLVPPTHGMAPPSYSSGKHSLGVAYGGGGNPGHKLPAYECGPHQSNGGMAGVPGVPGGGRTGEVDFIETLVGSNEEWLNNLTMIDEYLEQNS